MRLRLPFAGSVLAALLFAGSACGATLPATEATRFVTQTHGELASYRINGASLSADETPLPSAELGSLWKLFVFSYLVAQQQTSPDYQCRGNDREEAYCCEAGGRIGREDALIKSCGRYFEPTRLQLQPTNWRDFWVAQQAPAWLHKLSNLHERHAVPVAELLAALDAVPADVRHHASHTLLHVLGQNTAGDALDHLGGLLRPKTWTMPDPRHPGMRRGGAAGWLADGSPFWLAGRGAGIEVLRRSAPALSDTLMRQQVPDDAQCIRVHFFKRYPLKQLVALASGQPARPGALTGHFRAHFENGNSLDFNANGELQLAQRDNSPSITGKFSINEYVARVIDREAAAEPRDAARALAVVIRSYLLQNARPDRDCLAIDDSTATQRVSPRPASAAARAIADWSDGLVLDRPAQYHLDKASHGVLSWTTARQSANSGEHFLRILSTAFPDSNLSSAAVTAGERCIAAPAAQKWLHDNLPRWHRQLQAEAGYSAPAQTPPVCMARSTNPHADMHKRRIYVHGWQSQQDRLAIAHEYLHLAFEGHPRADNEDFVERLARHLILGTP
ncbi:DUF2300 domain-containing protein [Viridibacterium curvum]|uniref:DUF2300 domain-containing protein n=1 Tax=Viridibacterium curvum TaxID=1101404 RepID=A0ABP9QUK7_9RHOO